jgi:hypothetical protein
LKENLLKRRHMRLMSRRGARVDTRLKTWKSEDKKKKASDPENGQTALASETVMGNKWRRERGT